MADGFNVNTEELAQCGQRVSAMSSQAESLHGRATAAEVPSTSWGLLGEMTTHSKYADMQNQLTDHLSNMTSGLSNAGQRISNTADLYRETDEYHKKQIEQSGGDPGDAGKVDPGRSGGPQQPTTVDGGPVPGGGHPPTGIGEHGGAPGTAGPVGGPGIGGPIGGPGAGGPIGGPPPTGLPTTMPAPGSPLDPGMTPDPGQAPGGQPGGAGKITIEVEGGGPVSVEVTGEAKEDVEVKGDIQAADGQTQHVDVHAQTDAAGHAKVSLQDPSAYQHMSGTLLPNTPEEQA
jgi:uncharacterized protein YukE